MKASSHCMYCQGNDENIDNPIHHPSYEITTRCNLNCIYCYSNVAVRKGKAPISGYYGDDRDVKAITISQFGEPLVAGVEEVVRVAKRLKDIFDARLDLQTNGTLLSKDATNKLEKFFDIIIVSLDAFSREKYVKITGFDLFESLVENIKALKDSSAKAILRTIYMPGINDEDTFKIAEFAGKLGMEMFLQPVSVYDADVMVKNGLNLSRAESIYEFIEISKKLSEISDVRIPGCFIVNVKRVSKLYGRDAIKFIKRNVIANVPEIRREWKFRV